MDSVCFFNNKGGVGKTTLLCNVASYIAETFSLKVLVVDADPQCNTTQLVLSQDQISALYSTARTRLKYGLPETILGALRPIRRGEPCVSENIEILDSDETRFGFDLITGHPGLSVLEDKFSQAWINFSSGDLGGARQTNWCNQIARQFKKSHHLIFFDVGPSLGPLNRSVLIGSGFFITPMSCDIFSIMGVENISVWLKTWLTKYEHSLDACREQGWGDELKELGVRESPEKMARFVGYSVQQYITRVERGIRRPTAAYERIRERIPNAIQKFLLPFCSMGLQVGDLDLGDIPNMFSLVPLAQSVNAPIHKLEARDGLNGAQYSQRDRYAEFVRGFASSLLKNLGYEIEA